MMNRHTCGAARIRNWTLNVMRRSGMEMGTSVDARARVGKQFIGTYIGGPLLDPRIPRQDISVIVVERGTINELDRDFFAQLTAIRPMPDFIKDGAPLELWMPIQVRLGTANATRKGMVFIHGLYFAHDPEKYRLTPLSRIGTKEDEYHNGNSVFPDQEWQRPPQPE